MTGWERRRNVQDLGEVERGFSEELTDQRILEEQTQLASQEKRGGGGGGEKDEARNTEQNEARHRSTRQRSVRAGCAASFHGSPHLTGTQSLQDRHRFVFI